jgi:hypothetical protein
MFANVPLSICTLGHYSLAKNKIGRKSDVNPAGMLTQPTRHEL